MSFRVCVNFEHRLCEALESLCSLVFAPVAWKQEPLNVLLCASEEVLARKN
jgi:hypothetical protein